MLPLSVSVPSLESKQGCVWSAVLLNIKLVILGSAMIEKKKVYNVWRKINK